MNLHLYIQALESALHLSRMAIEQNASIDTKIASNGPTVGQIISEAFSKRNIPYKLYEDPIYLLLLLLDSSSFPKQIKIVRVPCYVGGEGRLVLEQPIVPSEPNFKKEFVKLQGEDILLTEYFVKGIHVLAGYSQVSDVLVVGFVPNW